jgi:hypothetical protein
LREPVADWPTAAREILEQARAEGLDFEQAWQRVEVEVRPLDSAGWGTLSSLGRGEWESPMAFAYRHLRAAYVRRSAARYCRSDCNRLRPCRQHEGRGPLPVHTHDEHSTPGPEVSVA